MNTLSKKVLIPMAAVAVIGAGAYGASQASADSSTATDPRASLIQKLSDKLGVDKTKVQAVFDEERTERQKEHEAQYEARLAQAVKDGNLTAAQKDAVLAKHKELKTKMEAAHDKTGTDRHTAMDSIRQEAQDWAKQNNIDGKWLMGGGPGHGSGHGRGHGGFGPGGGQPPADAQ